jgi:hypothetical protein
MIVLTSQNALHLTLHLTLVVQQVAGSPGR